MVAPQPKIGGSDVRRANPLRKNNIDRSITKNMGSKKANGKDNGVTTEPSDTEGFS